MRNDHEHHDHHAHMVADFRRRFWVSMALTFPILVLAPLVQRWLGFEVSFPGDRIVQWSVATIVYVYGGWPFLTGLCKDGGEGSAPPSPR